MGAPMASYPNSWSFSDFKNFNHATECEVLSQFLNSFNEL